MDVPKYYALSLPKTPWIYTVYVRVQHRDRAPNTPNALGKSTTPLHIGKHELKGWARIKSLRVLKKKTILQNIFFYYKFKIYEKVTGFNRTPS